MYRYIRTATVKTAAQLPAAIAFAAQVTAQLNSRYTLNMRFGVEQFGRGRIHWHFDADSLDAMQKINAQLMEDRDYIALLDKFKDTWVEGSMRDTLVRLV